MEIRRDIINKISPVMGIYLNEEFNADIGNKGKQKEGMISLEGSKIDAFVIPTNEELMILKDTCACILERQEQVQEDCKVLKRIK